jgi:hypothetical protein
MKSKNATNNFAEFNTFDLVLRDAIKEQHQAILVVTDSQMVYDFALGLNNTLLPHLKEIAASIRLQLKQIPTIYVSKVFSHRHSTVMGNQIADALCTWAMNSKREQPLHLQLTARTLADRLIFLNKDQILQNCDKNNAQCSICLKEQEHSQSSCCIRSYHPASENSSPCLVCLGADHKAENCSLYSNPVSRPALAKPSSHPAPVLNPLLQDIASIDFDSINFPRNQTGAQFDDYFETIFSTMFFSKNDPARQQAAEKAISAWSANYRVDRNAIRRVHCPKHSAGMDGPKPHSAPPDDPLLIRAKKAAALGVDARAGDVAKALRSSPSLELTDEVELELKRLYPQPLDDFTVFEPLPLQNYEVNRHKVARYIMSRSRRSHPGTLGLSFGILQLYCIRTYKKESRDSPDPRWTIFCELVSKVMTGNALHMSPMLHAVFGSYFDKNFEKVGASPSIRNIGVEETLLRIPAALVFDEVLQDAIERGFITHFDLGAGKRAGAEIFARIAEMCSTKGCIITVMDVIKAFNNLRRRDIKAAVADFNNPLFTAFIHFLFERNPSVCFKDRLSGRSLICELITGILQGNPISVFLFTLTVAFILRPFRDKYKNEIIVSAFVDDMQVISSPSTAQLYPERLREFFGIFADHGLSFDFAEIAKTSVYSLNPLPGITQSRLQQLGLRTQTEGISPCKIPIDTESFVASYTQKALTKLTTRFHAFEALWPALLALDANSRRPSLRTHEHFLNLVRLSFLSMSTYTLRTINPSACEPYAVAAAKLANTLIDKVFPPLCQLQTDIPSNTRTCIYPSMLDISRRIMQLPLSRGGLSLRLPTSIFRIAYAASCIDCSQTVALAAAALRIRGYDPYDFGELKATAHHIYSSIPTINSETFFDAFHETGADCNLPSAQHSFTALLNDHDVEAIAQELAPTPMYFLAFKARTDPKQDHSSWPFNPVVRAHYSIGPLLNSEFSRAVQLASLRPAFPKQGWCSVCREEIDPVGLHLLKCKSTHFTEMHNVTKHALAQRLRSLMTAQMAAISVHVEKPVSRWCKLLPQFSVETVVRVADIVILLSGLTQQDVIVTDVVSTLCRTPNASDGFYYELNQAETAKRNTYRMYDITLHHFFPLAFGRTNILSRESLRFCDFVGNYFPKSLKVANRLRATFSRSIAAGVASTFNSAVRRLQLSEGSLVALSMIPPMPEVRRFSTIRSQLSKVYAGLNRVSAEQLPARFADIVSCDPFGCGPDGSRVQGHDSADP